MRLVVLLLLSAVSACSIPRWPVNAPVTSPFGLRFLGLRPDFHHGVDLAVPVETQRKRDRVALALRLNAPIFASEELLDHTAEDVGQTGEEGTTEYDAEDLKEYLRRMNPEDFGRFTM